MNTPITITYAKTGKSFSGATAGEALDYMAASFGTKNRGCDFKKELVRVTTWVPGRRDLELDPTLDDEAFVDQMADIGFLRVSRGCLVA